MKNTCLLFTLLLFIMPLAAQKPFNYKSFDEEHIDIYQKKRMLQESEYAHIGFTPTYTHGLKGLALDLTDDVGVRIPVILDSLETPDYNKSFSVSLWVKTKPGAVQGTPIMSNKKVGESNNIGWTIGTNKMGAWSFNISNGKSTYDYNPTAERQSINDGNWHHIAVSIDFSHGEIWYFFDGKNVAIYNIENLSDANSGQNTIIGGANDYTDWGSRGEWTAFNGMIDEVKLFDTKLSTGEIKKLFSEFNKVDKPENLLFDTTKIKLQVWNIWHGGHRYGEHVGLQRVIDVLKGENADIIGLIETYGSGEVIADSLNYYFYLISSNLSIMSRYPIDSTFKIFKSFFSGGAVLDLGNGRKVNFVNLWLNASPDYCQLINSEADINKFFEEEEKTRQHELKNIIEDIQDKIELSNQYPLFVMGDFNCGSHSDWTEGYKKLHYDYVIEWKTSKLMEDHGFKDSFREINPDVLKDPGFTWSPLINKVSDNPGCIRDRIDYIYYHGAIPKPYYSRMIDYHPVFWPSDHASVVANFYLDWD